MGEVPDPTTWLLGKPSEAHPDRRATKHVIFGHTFETPPQVVAAIKALDAAGDDAKGDLRINTWADNITREGFDLNVQTWNRSPGRQSSYVGPQSKRGVSRALSFCDVSISYESTAPMVTRCIRRYDG